MFTQQQISQMKEAEFQNKVLIPLFRSMGYRDVTPFDGQSLERGKDIVMWKEGDLGERVNYGVVVKAVKITGKVTGKNSALETLSQARQMLNNSFIDPVTGRKQELQRCYIASSMPISKEAMYSIEGDLDKSALNKVINFIHPETNLFSLVEKYLPHLNVFEKLGGIQKFLDDSTKGTPYKLIADSDGSISIWRRDKKSVEEKPFKVHGKFKFDLSSQEGKDALEKYQNHLKTGAPLEIDGKNIESFNLPDFIPEWIRPTLSDDAKLILEPVRSGEKVPVRIDIVSEDGQRHCLDYVDLEIVQKGSEQATLDNNHQDVPWLIKIVVDFNVGQNKSSFSLSMRMKDVPTNVHQELTGLKFIRALNNVDGQVTITLLKTGIIFYTAQIVAKTPAEEAQNDLIILLEELSFIQSKTATELSIRGKNISPEEIEAIFWAGNVLRTGKIKIDFGSELKTKTEAAKAKEVLEAYGNGDICRFFIEYPENAPLTILDSDISLGNVVVHLNARLTEKEVQRVEEELRNVTLDDKVEIRYLILQESVNATLPKWLPTE